MVETLGKGLETVLGSERACWQLLLCMAREACQTHAGVADWLGQVGLLSSLQKTWNAALCGRIASYQSLRS